jgi:hypothetical protein
MCEVDELRTRLNMEEVWSINVLEGPSKSGKSTTSTFTHHEILSLMHSFPFCTLFCEPDVGVCIVVCCIQMNGMTKIVLLVQQLIDGRPNTVYLSVREKSEEIPILIAESFGAIGEKKENLKGLSSLFHYSLILFNFMIEFFVFV